MKLRPEDVLSRGYVCMEENQRGGACDRQNILAAVGMWLAFMIKKIDN